MSLVRVAWWDLGNDNRYFWDHLIEHLLDAGRPIEAEKVAGDLRWVGARLAQFGPAAAIADLSAVGTPQAVRLRAVLARMAHLLAPTEPARAVVDVLHSLVADDPYWGLQVTALREVCRRPRLVNYWPQSGRADSALRRALTGHTFAVTAVAIAPDGTWLASGSRDGTARIWDVANGKERTTLTGHPGTVTAVAIAPDGSWLATGGEDGTVRIWDVTSGRERAALKARSSALDTLAIAPDGSWLAASYSHSDTVRIWDVASCRERMALEYRSIEEGPHFVMDAGSRAMAVAPDGSWLAMARFGERAVRIWDLPSGRERATLTGDRVLGTGDGGGT